MGNFPAFADYVLAVVFGIVMPFVSGFRSKTAFAELQTAFDSSTKKKFYLGNSFFLFMVAAIIIAVWAFYRRPLAELGLVPAHPVANHAYWWLIGLFILLYLLELVHSLLSPQEMRDTKNQLAETPFMPTRWQEIPAYLVMCSAAGICEELIFRGYMITFFRYVLAGLPGVSAWAIVVPAAIFGIAHYYQGAKAVFKILVLSVLFGMIFWHSGSLYAVMILHFSVDFIGGITTILLHREVSDDK